VAKIRASMPRSVPNLRYAHFLAPYPSGYFPIEQYAKIAWHLFIIILNTYFLRYICYFIQGNTKELKEKELKRRH
jgi:hypothetical protein